MNEHHDCSTCPIAGKKQCIIESTADWLEEHWDEVKKLTIDNASQLSTAIVQVHQAIVAHDQRAVVGVQEAIIAWAYAEGYKAAEGKGEVANLSKVYGEGS